MIGLPEILLGVALLGVVVLVVVVLLWRRRRAPTPNESVDRMMESMRLTHPSFFVALSYVRKAGLMGEFMERDEVRRAVEILANADEQRKNRRRDRRGALLSLTPGSGDVKTQAALLTVLRSIYLDDRVRPGLPPKTLDDLDRFLETLTG